VSELLDFIKDYGGYAGAASILGLAVLSLLYFAQAREVKRLREWAGRAPERAAELEQRVMADATRRGQTGALPVRTPPPPRPGQPQTAAAQAGGPRPATANGQPAPDGAPAGAVAAAAAGTAGAVAAGAASAPDGTAPATPGEAAPPAVAAPGDAAPAAAPQGAAAPAAPAAPAPGGADAGGADGTPPPPPQPPAPGTAAPAAPPAAGGTAGAGLARTAAGPGGPRPVPPRSAAPRPRTPAAGGRPPGAPLRAGMPSAYVVPEEPPRRSRTPLVIAGLAALALAIAAVLAIALGGGDGGDDTAGTEPATNTVAPPVSQQTTRTDTPARGEVTVAVLNGTTINGLAAKTADRLRGSGFQVPSNLVGNVASVQTRSQTIVSHVEGATAEARDVARVLGIGADAVAPIDANTRVEAGGGGTEFQVVVTVGSDSNASPQG
jgi:hypothetical protein